FLMPSAPGSNPLLFRNDTDTAGLRFTDVTSLLPGGLAGAAAGLAVASYGDYRQALFVANAQGAVLLQADGPNGSLVDVSPARGLNVAGGAIAAALGDVDRNRRADIIVLASDGRVTAPLAAPDGRFSPVSVSPSG